jgi:hypothetical protein
MRDGWEIEVPPQHEVIEFWLKVFGVFGALIALTVTWRTHAERATFEMIDRLYTLCHTLQAHALREWYLAHLFCIGEGEYNSVKARIKMQASTEPTRCAEFAVKEKLFAIHVFIIYEQVFYQWKHTSRVLHRRRRRFLAEMLSYFTDRLLQNPRLVAFLRADPSGASLHLESCSKRFIDQAIERVARKSGITVVGDGEGPFAQHEPQDEQARSAATAQTGSLRP